MNKMFKGTIMVLVAGIFWGISGVSGQYLMAHGMNVDVLSCVRLITAGVIMTTIAALNQRETFLKAVTSLKALGGIAVFAIIGLLMNQYAYLMAIHYTNAGTATVLQYVAPIIILAYVSLKNKQLPTLSEFFAILFAILGTFVIATHGHFDGLAMTPKGFFWGLFSAVTYSFYIILPAKLIREYGSFTVIGLGMLMGGVVFPIVTRSWQYPLVLTSGNWLALFGIIIIGTVFAYTFFLKGTMIIGAVKGSLLAAIEPVSSVFFSVTVMHEIFYPMDFLGMIFIIAAVILISLRDLVVVNKQIHQ
ncbi:integral membrane protein, permease [Streptococcus infantarius subsp. infantarius]|nr:integral membrane protein, permease [Streptococcus infantarius subsp. infantarius]MCO4470647.1 integral membrane protein, permease [Streptococcus infantarius subsp. infantarius]MCO4478360.1 integral membrane protein, permease [Streptococcus infantarius subsp. infantarius]